MYQTIKTLTEILSYIVKSCFFIHQYSTNLVLQCMEDKWYIVKQYTKRSVDVGLGSTSLMVRAIRLSVPKCSHTNLAKVSETLINNNYPP